MNTLNFAVNDIISICKAEMIQDAGRKEAIQDIITDSRHIIQGGDLLFIALKGSRHDGHLFVHEAYSKGVRTFLLMDLNSAPALPADCTIMRVPNSLAALQSLAAAHRKKFDIPVVGITGSNGKTMVKEWLYQLLSPDKDVIRSPKSYNSQVGVPLSVFHLNGTHQLAIFEAGISQPGEMINLEHIIQPTAGIFTNIGAAHDENFIDHRQKAAEKLQLFVHCKKLIYCADDFEIQQKLISSGLSKKIELFPWGKSQDTWLQILHTSSTPLGTTVTGKMEGKTLELFIPFTDKASVENLIHCWAFMLSEKTDHEVIANRFRKLTPVEMRLELKEGRNRCSIINDSYNSDINSLSIAIDFLEKNKEYKKKTVILSDILQSGKKIDVLADEIANLISRRGIDRFIGIGENLFAGRKKFGDNAVFFKTTEDFIREFDLSTFSDEMILLKGARKFGFERISSLIEEKVHETILTTDLNALTENINFFKSRLSPGTRIMAMVKAFAYGSGAVEIARHLEYHRFDYLAVAYADEGVALRNAGISLPIMVMSPEENSFYFMFRYHLEPEIYSFGTLNLLLENLQQFDQVIEYPVKIHIKLDTGMHRLGFDKKDLPGLIDVLSANQDKIEVVSVFSHFSAADEPEETAFTKKQLETLKKFADQLEKGLGYPLIKHISNSAAIISLPEAHLDMVRIGIGLYGIDPSGLCNKDLQPVVTLKTRILQIRQVAAGESIGYGTKAKAGKLRTTATLAIGYADGFHRCLGNGNWSVSIRGQKAPVVGNICMDMCIADITGLKDIKEGDEVEIFGNHRSLTDYAIAMGTIPYEALTSVSARVKRIYVQHE